MDPPTLNEASLRLRLSMPPPSSKIVAFPPFALDLRAGSLLRDGAAVNVRPKTFAVLEYLAEHPGELVTKRALLDAIWGDSR